MAVLLVLLAIQPVPTLGQTKKDGLAITDWTPIATGNEDQKSFYGTNTPRRGDDYIKVWSRFDARSGESLFKLGKVKIASARVFMVLDCKQNRAQALTGIFYYPDGSVAKTLEHVMNEWADEKPGTMGYVIFEYFCEREVQHSNLPPKLKKP